MGPCTKAGGLITRLMDLEGSSTLMETCTMASGLMIKLMDSGFTAISMGPSTKVSGKRTNSTVKDLKRGLIMLATRGSTLKEGNMGKGSSRGLMAVSMKDFS